MLEPLPSSQIFWCFAPHDTIHGVDLSASVWYPTKAVALFAIVLAVARKFRHTDHPFAQLGPANQTTALRAALVSVAAGLIGEAAVPGNASVAVTAATMAALLDGVDGWLARRTKMSSAFGARFDMEVDALLIMVLSVLAWQYDKAGAWVLGSGLLRYAFIAAGWVWPWMQEPLLPSRRRQTICVVQVVGLILTVAPFVTAPLSTMTAATALIALAWSFLVDTLWLWRHAAPAHPAAVKGLRSSAD